MSSNPVTEPNSIHVLLVEDDPSHVELIRRSFTEVRRKVRVSATQSLQAAKEFLRTERPDILFVDHLLPDGDGIELLTDLSSVSTPMVLMSSYGNEHVAVEAIKAGALDYLVKSEESLRAVPVMLERVLREWAHVQQTAKLEAELRQAQKMDAIGTLASGVAHDFNNLLTAIHGYAEMALQEEPGVRSREPIERIQYVVNQAAGLTRSLLMFSRRVKTEKVKVDLEKLVRETARLLKRLFPASVEMRISIQVEGGAWVEGDRNQLQQVIMNLMINARDSMAHGGVLELSLRTQTQPERFVILQVKDSGCGMDEATKARVFEPFFTTKTREQGTGLGLSVVLGIVRDHGGKIDLETCTNQGTCFTVSWPWVEQPSNSANPAAGKSRPGHRHERVLIAEDNPAVRDLVQQCLQKIGMEVHSVADGEALLERMQRGPLMELVILDLDLPKRSGESCLRFLRESGRQVPVILMSGALDQLQEWDGDSRVRCLSKPFAMAQLQEAVETILGPSKPVRGPVSGTDKDPPESTVVRAAGA